MNSNTNNWINSHFVVFILPFVHFILLYPEWVCLPIRLRIVHKKKKRKKFGFFVKSLLHVCLLIPNSFSFSINQIHISFRLQCYRFHCSEHNGMIGRGRKKGSSQTHSNSPKKYFIPFQFGKCTVIRFWLSHEICMYVRLNTMKHKKNGKLNMGATAATKQEETI